MLNNDLVIERLNVDVFTDALPHSNALLQAITEQIKTTILPRVEAELISNNDLNAVQEMSFDRIQVALNLDVFESNETKIAASIIQALSAKVAEKGLENKRIKDQIIGFTQSDSEALNEKRIRASQLAESFTKDANDPNRKLQILQLMHFLKYGYLTEINSMEVEKDVGNNSNRDTQTNQKVETLEHYFEELIKNESFCVDFGALLVKNEQFQKRFKNQFSEKTQSVLWSIYSRDCHEIVSDIFKFLSQNTDLLQRYFNQVHFWSKFMSHDLAELLVHLIQKMERNTRMMQYFIQKVNFIHKNKSKITENDIIALIKKSHFGFYQIMNQIVIKNEIKHELLTKISLELMKSTKNDDFNLLTETIKKQTSQATFAFLDYLRSDFALSEKIDPVLRNYIHLLQPDLTVDSWMVLFVNTLKSSDIISGILFELEELKPTNGHRIQNTSYIKELTIFVSLLEDRLTTVIDGRSTDMEGAITKKVSEKYQPNTLADLFENEASYRLAKNERVAITNAGLVLLNPFFPILFKNLELQNQTGEWTSETHQVQAIYLLHYLATGIWGATEDQLYLAKIITNYSLKEILPPFDETEKGPWHETNQTLLTAELTNILEVIQENWRPMRNCTWDGLRNDFLTRAGHLELKENMQYKLTIEPHTLDVLIPHIKWGMAMIKYSWMQQILNVGWGD